MEEQISEEAKIAIADRARKELTSTSRRCFHSPDKVEGILANVGAMKRMTENQYNRLRFEIDYLDVVIESNTLIDRDMLIQDLTFIVASFKSKSSKIK
ncbi:MAG: hypothetical protein PHS44_06400 [Candidatus Dojkabacteria bacterium]|nr:hypothetical protein [Candidatus Dojkabacteria bacterium]